MKRIRILEIISGFAVEGPLGGIERFGIELAKTLDPTRFAPVVCGMWAYGTPYEMGWLEQLQAEGIEAFIAADWAEASPYESFRQAWRGMKEQVANVDIIHSHCQFGDIAALLLKKQFGAKKMIRTVHNEREWGKSPARRLFLTNFVYPLAFDRELGVAQQVVDNLNKRPLVQIRQQKANLFYNALNSARFQPQNKKQRTRKLLDLGLDPTQPLIGTIGRLTAQKGYHLFLEAAAQLLVEHPSWQFLIVGSGELEAELKALAQELEIEQRVYFLGARNDIEELLPCFDLFVSSSLWEGLPTVILESMAARVPIIATAVPGNTELIRPEKTGILVPVNDPITLGRSILRFLTEWTPAQKEELTNNAYQHLQNKFSIKAVAHQHEQLYTELVEGCA